MDIDVTALTNAIHPIGSKVSDGALEIGMISTDTRTIQKGDLFVALSGPKYDGHDFIEEAFEKGARHFIVSKEVVPPRVSAESNVYLVADTLKAYGDLAKYFRSRFQIPAVAVTGSSGKTTVKELTHHILSAKFKALKNRGTENNLVGVPKTLLMLEPSHEVMVIEMGTNQPGEIDRLSSIVSPQIGVVTQIGSAHLEGLKDTEGVRKEKLSLLNHLARGGLLVLSGEDPILREVRSGVHKIVRVGFTPETGDLYASQVWCHEKGTTFYLNGKDLVETALIGKHNALNCLMAMAVAEFLGVEPEVIRKAVGTFKSVPGRMQLKNLDGVLFIDDTYNANPHSFRSAVETLKEFKIREKKGIVCGDMLELGESSERLHRELGAALAGHLFDFVITVGPLSRFVAEEALKSGLDAGRVHSVKDSREAGKLCRKLCGTGDMVLVKGSRGMQMERVFDCFTTSSTP